MASDTAAPNCQPSKEKDGKNKERKLHVKRRYSERDSEPVVKTRRKSIPENLYLTPPLEKENTSTSALSKASNQAYTFGPLFSYSFKSKKKISRAKVKARSEIGLFDWGKHGYHKMYWGTRPGVDKVPRVNYNSTSRQEFIDKFEQPNIPAVICGLTKLWPANVHWNIDYLLANYGNQKFKVGEDDDGENVYLKLKHFFPYSEHEAILDDSPLYVFDSAFSKNLYFKQEAPSPSGPSSRDEKMGLAKVTLLEDFFIPKYFDVDLFSLTGSRRPPHRWLVMGGARSGTHIHVDPLGTSAWNALIKGHKRYVLLNLAYPQDGLFSLHKPLLAWLIPLERRERVKESLGLPKCFQNSCFLLGSQAFLQVNNMAIPAWIPLLAKP
ncbi:hypothetical protein DSO57_1022949 [Entomophthora muscae]|uniref:Uncharacterized protein n=1 Tax=Entomophthora muscae TaxID=34485 RepID=A0ACC2S514_9FUNG|nr:hypothetical protein DSO57_1022949 [Entomophthora muscae]